MGSQRVEHNLSDIAHRVKLFPASQETCLFRSLDSTDKSIIYAIESAVIQWSHQIQLVLKRESSQPLLQGENPTPQVELEFWRTRWAQKRLKKRGVTVEPWRECHLPVHRRAALTQMTLSCWL